MTNKHYKGNEMIRRLVIGADFVILNIVLLFYTQYGQELIPAYFDKATKITFFVANAALFLGEYFYSTIIHVRKIGFLQVTKRTLYLAAATTFCFFTFSRLLGHGGKMFSFSIIFGITFYLSLIISRLCELKLLKYFRSKGRNSRTVVFVGNDPAVSEMYKTMTEDPSAGYIVKGYYADEDITDNPEGLKRIGNMKQLKEIISSTMNDTINGEPSNIDEVFCCLSHKDPEIINIIHFCDKNVIHFYYLPRVFGEYKLHLDAQNFMGRTVYSNRIEPLTSTSNRIIKRSFDIVVSGLACLCVLPFIPFIALIIKIQSPGPIFFKQARTGLNGDTFYCLKFRSMHVNKDADKAQATKNDPRKFAFGNFMRKTNIDEFPQFFNVLKGDMSIVGPRPHMLHHTEVYGSLIDKYMVRHFSKPGITGWAQVTGFRGETKELWQMDTLESTGTHNILELLPFFMIAAQGYTAVIDEMDTGIHDLLVMYMLQDIFPDIKGQLIITTHNTLVMTSEFIPANSFYVIQEDEDGTREIKCITDIDGRVHPYHNKQLRYIVHKEYGAVPDKLNLSIKELAGILKSK